MNKIDVLKQILESQSNVHADDVARIVKKFEKDDNFIDIMRLCEDGYYVMAAIMPHFLKVKEQEDWEVMYMRMQKINSNLGKAMTIIRKQIENGTKK